MSTFVYNTLYQMGSLLFFLSYKYNDEMPWNSPSVIVTLCLSVTTFVVFIIVELLIAPEPVLAPFLLRKKVPMLIGISNVLVRIPSLLMQTIIYYSPLSFRSRCAASPSCTSFRCSSKLCCWPRLQRRVCSTLLYLCRLTVLNLLSPRHTSDAK